MKWKISMVETSKNWGRFGYGLSGLSRSQFWGALQGEIEKVFGWALSIPRPRPLGNFVIFCSFPNLNWRDLWLKGRNALATISSCFWRDHSSIGQYKSIHASIHVSKQSTSCKVVLFRQHRLIPDVFELVKYVALKFEHMTIQCCLPVNPAKWSEVVHHRW